MTLTEKVAFLNGLIEGSDLKLGEKEDKVFGLLVELLGDLATAVTEIDEDLAQLYDEVDEVSDALEDLEDFICELDDDVDVDMEEMDDDDFMYEIQCEKCGNTIVVDEDSLLAEELSCPSCGEVIELEFDCDCDDCDDDCDCGCGNDHKD